ncbi:acyltransferase [Mucilaginibacter sp. 3215]|uniref:acyltransferase n=1 Tax=Mucilaginibacter sp. 3215 TaxID=3373912 RepID=UPI003D24FEED
MKGIIKNLLVRLINLTNMPHYIEQVKQDKKLKHINASITNNGGLFYHEAEVSNLTNDKSKLIIGKNTHCRAELFVYPYARKLQIGSDCYIGKNTIIRAGDELIIGDNVLISHNVTIMDTDSHEIDNGERAASFKKLTQYGHPAKIGNVKIKPVYIHDHVWISYNCCILKGVTIGKGAIVAAGSVVTKDVEPFTMVAGNPAQFIKALPQQ